MSIFLGQARRQERVSLHGLATELVAGEARLLIRIDAGQDMPDALQELQASLLEACAARADGKPASGTPFLLDDRPEGSMLVTDGESPPSSIFRLAMELARLDAALRNFAGLPVRFPGDDEGLFRYLASDLQQRCFHRDFWLFELAACQPRLHQRLLEAGVDDDHAWTLRERHLEADPRLKAGGKRFDFACRASQPGPGEPIAMLTPVVAAVPAWLNMSEPLLLAVVPDLQRILDAGIEHFDELSRMDEDEVEQRTGLRPDQLRSLARELGKWIPLLLEDLVWQGIAGVSARDDEPVSLADFSSLGQLVAWLLSRLVGHDWHDQESREDWRNQQRILAGRIGEPSIAGFVSLQQLSDEIFGPSTQGGERVRQNQVRVVNHLRRARPVAVLLEELEQSITDFLDRKGKAVPMGTDCPIGALATTEPSAGERFLKLFFRDGRLPRYQLTEDGSRLVRYGAASALDQLVSELLRVIRARTKASDRQYGRIMPSLEAIIEQATGVPRREVGEQFLDTLNWSDSPPDGNSRLVSRGTTAAAVVVAVLASSARPMTRGALVEACAQSSFHLDIKVASLGNVLATLIADPRNESNPDIFEGVFQTGHGLYACQADLPLDIEALAPLAERAADLIRTGRRSLRDHPVYGNVYQWHCIDLVECLEADGELDGLIDIDPEQRWYLLDAILRYHQPEGVIGLQKGFWMARVAGVHPDDHVKVDQNDVVEWVLENLSDGEPMPMAEVREMVARVQSLGASGQLQVASRIPEGSRLERAGRGLLSLRET